MPVMPTICPHCGGTLEPGFIEDLGRGSTGYARWIQGPLERGPLGGARRLGKRRHAIQAQVCSMCGSMALFVDIDS